MMGGKISSVFVVVFVLLCCRLDLYCAELSDSEGAVLSGQHLSVHLEAETETIDFPADLIMNYERLHNKYTSTDLKLPHEKFVVFEPVITGTGNKLEALISTFLFGLMTDRALVVHPKWESLLSVTKSPLRLSYSILERKGITLDMVSITPSVDFLCKGNLTNTYKDQVIKITGNQYFAPLLMMNVMYRQWVERHFGSVQAEVFKPLVRYLLQPSAQMQEQIDELYETKFKDNYVIGLQIRRTEQYLENEHVDLFLTCAENTAAPFSEDGRRVVYFLATDWDPVRSLTLSVLGKESVFHSNVHIDVRNTAARLRFDDYSSFLDFFLLSMCDDLIVTCGSSYGRIAAGRSGIIPQIVNGNHGMCHLPQSTVDEPCYRARWSEPRSWPTLALLEAAKCISPTRRQHEHDRLYKNRHV